MKLRFALSLIALVIASPAMGHPVQRIDEVATLASTVCPDANRSTGSGEEFVVAILDAAERLDLSDDDRFLLVTFCNLYMRGSSDGLAAALALAERIAR